MLTDRERVEAGIVPALIYGIVKPMEDLQETDEEKAHHKQVVDAAFAAMMDPLDDLPEKHAAKIARRTDREYQALGDILEDASNAQAMMAVYYMLEGLLQEGRLTIYEDTEFGRALTVYMAAIDHYFAERRLDAAAQKRARQLREALRKRGYFA